MVWFITWSGEYCITREITTALDSILETSSHVCSHQCPGQQLMRIEGLEGLPHFLKGISTTAPYNSVLRGKGTLENKSKNWALVFLLPLYFCCLQTLELGVPQSKQLIRSHCLMKSLSSGGSLEFAVLNVNNSSSYLNNWIGPLSTSSKLHTVYHRSQNTMVIALPVTGILNPHHMVTVYIGLIKKTT